VSTLFGREFLQSNLHLIVPAAALLSVVAAVTGAWALCSARRGRAVLGRLSGGDQQAVGNILLEQVDALQKLASDMKGLSQEVATLRGSIERCVSRVGVVRFNAFEGVGPDQSYAIALLDASMSGVIITGLHGRHESRTYVKPLIQGESPYALSDEEREALRRARDGRLWGPA